MRDLIVFGEDWGGLPSSTQHLIRHLSKDRQVLWVNSIGLRQPRWSDWKRVWNKALGMLSASVPVPASTPDNVTVISPRALPLPVHPSLRALSRTLLKRQIQPWIARLKLNDPILWLSLPSAVDMVRHLGESAVVYYCGDDFSALAGVDHAIVAERERELVAKADAIWVASSRLAQQFPAEKTRVLEHGVDWQLFSTPQSKAPALPDDRPVAGFYGSISEWLDQELIIQVAQRLQHWLFVFVGKVHVDVQALAALPNVVFLGGCSHEELPRYSQHWTASCLPFRDNEQIRACNPLKLREYLAAGTPIVSTPFPALAPYSTFVEVADTAQNFALTLQKVHTNLTRQSNEARRLRVKHEDWSNKAEQVSTWLAQL